MEEDTIVAIATPMGYGGIGIIRISGNNALLLARKHTTRCKFIPWKLGRTSCIDKEGRHIDDILAVYMPAPNSFTGEDIVELHCHGSPIVLKMVLEELIESGARSATRGEFSKRALLNNKMSLSQAEAVLEVINAPDVIAMRIAQERLKGHLAEAIEAIREAIDILRMQLYISLDFPEDDLDIMPRDALYAQVAIGAEQVQHLLVRYAQERVWQEGAKILLAGSVNAGKSSILNAILGRVRAIVSDIAGTTRDFVTETISLHGIPITIMDTAGLRATEDTIEKIGIESTHSNAQVADSIIFIIDSTRNELEADEKAFLEKYKHKNSIFIYNKADLQRGEIEAYCSQGYPNIPSIQCSAKDGFGIQELLSLMYTQLTANSSIHVENNPIIPNVRQAILLKQADTAFQELLEGIKTGIPYDIIITVLDTISEGLAEITGHSLSEDLMNRVFDSFCIGK